MSLISSDSKLRQYLDQIDEMLCDPKVGGALADILSCVRGPDYCQDDWSGGEVAKQNTTTWVRKEAFPKVCKITVEGLNFAQSGASRWSLYQAPSVLEKGVIDLNSARPSGSHFVNHIREAAIWLNIKFTE